MAGGLFTPTLSTGAVLGAALGQAWSLLWPGALAGAYAVLVPPRSSATQAPLAGPVLVLELTHNGVDLLVPMILAMAVVATVIARWIDGYSIYSARLEGR